MTDRYRDATALRRPTGTPLGSKPRSTWCGFWCEASDNSEAKPEQKD